MKSMKKFIFWILILFLIVFTRFYNIEETSRFIWDESSDLVSIHRIWVDKDITLIGPISEDGNKVFGSLTYYLLMPFAILFDFSPISTTIGASFYGVLTALLMIYLIYKVRGKFEILPTLLIIFWPTILIPSRWAWNPNFMLLWSTLALIAFMSKNRFRYFLTGFLISINIHHHYLAFYTVFFLGIYLLFEAIKEKKINNLLSYSVGALLPIIPFIAFDLTHLPGLFLTRILYFNYIETDSNIITKLTLSGVLFILLLLPLVVIDIKRRSESLKYLFVFMSSSLVILLTTVFNNYYILSSVPFVFVYVISKRKGIEKYYVSLVILFLIVSSLFKVNKILNNSSWDNNILAITKISSILETEIKNNDLKNVNIAVLQSPDNNTYGRRYRDLLLIKDITVLSKYEYDITDNLFVISYGNESEVRNDAAYEIRKFRDKKLISSWEIDNSEWKVYLFRN